MIHYVRKYVNQHFGSIIKMNIQANPNATNSEMDATQIINDQTVLTIDEYELISEALSVYTNSLNDGKGITLINRQAGRLLAKLQPRGAE